MCARVCVCVCVRVCEFGVKMLKDGFGFGMDKTFSVGSDGKSNTRFYPTIVRIIMFTGEANWPVCTENVKGISCLESITHVLPGQS